MSESKTEEPKFAGTQITKTDWLEIAERAFRERELIPMLRFLQIIEGSEALVEATRPIAMRAVLKGPIVKGKFMDRIRCLEVVDRVYHLTEDELMQGYKCTKTTRGFPYKHELMHGCGISMVKYPRLLAEFALKDDTPMLNTLCLLKSNSKIKPEVLEEMERLLTLK